MLLLYLNYRCPGVTQDPSPQTLTLINAPLVLLDHHL